MKQLLVHIAILRRYYFNLWQRNLKHAHSLFIAQFVCDGMATRYKIVKSCALGINFDRFIALALGACGPRVRCNKWGSGALNSSMLYSIFMSHNQCSCNSC